MIDEKRLVEVFTVAFGETKRLDAAVLAVARDAVASTNAHDEAETIAKLQNRVSELREKLKRLKTPHFCAKDITSRGDWTDAVLRAIAAHLEIPIVILTPIRKPRKERAFNTFHSRRRFVAMSVLLKAGLTRQRIADLMRLETSSVRYGINWVQRHPEAMSEVEKIWATIPRRPTLAAPLQIVAQSDETEAA